MKRFSRIQELFKRHGLSIELEKNQTVNGTEPHSTADLDHYTCRLKKESGEMEISLSAQHSADKVTLWDVLFVLAMDASACEMLKGFEEFRREILDLFDEMKEEGLEMNSFFEEYKARCAQALAVRRFLGETIYGELLNEVH